MAVCDVSYYSPALRKAVGAQVILPEIEGQDGPFPVLYLLHGLTDDYTAWMRNTSLARYVVTLPLCVVLFDGGRGFYTDAREGFAYESALIEDAIPFMDRHFNTRSTREGRAIGGMSMGGYGAIKMAFKHPELFVSAHGHSGAYGFPALGWRDQEAEFARIIGPGAIGGPDDLFALAAQAKRAQTRLPALRLDCGTGDFLIEHSRQMHRCFEEAGIEHEYHEAPGGHDWAYWDRHIQGALRFHTRHLGISKPRLRAS